MRFRKLRTAWSVFCGLAAVLLIVLWVRSYWWLDFGSSAGNHRWASAQGKVFWNKRVVPMYAYTGPTPPPYPVRRFGINSLPHAVSRYFVEDGGITIPFWMPVVLMAMLVAAPWHAQRFSLRTLLIVTTLVAVVLGLIVWLNDH